MADTYDSTYDDPEKILTADEASAVVLEHYRRSEEGLVDKMRDKWKEWYKGYRAYVEVDEDDIKSNLVYGLIFSHIESYLPRLVANRPRIEVWGRGPEDKLRAAQNRSLLNYDWDMLKMSLKIVDFCKSAQIYGTSWFKVYHKREIRTRLVKEIAFEPKMFMGLIPMGEEPVQKEVEQPIVVWDDPWVDMLEPDEVFPDPDGKDEDSCAWIIHRFPVGLDHLELSVKANGEPLYDQKAVRMLKEKSKGGNQEARDMDETVRREREETFGAEMQSNIDQHKRRFHVIEQWSDDKIMSVIEGFPDVPPLRNERNPYGMKPFARFTPVPDPNAIYGISVAEMLHSLQLELSTLHNVRMDHIVQAAHQMHTIIRGSNINPRNVRFRPGGSFFVNSHEDIRPLDMRPLEFSAYRESEDMRQWSQQISGASDPFSGRSDQGGKTATEAALLNQASASRAGLMFQILGMQPLNRVGRLLMRINEYHIDTPRLVRIIGDDFAGTQYVKIQPEEFASRNGMDLDLVIDIAETEPANKMFRRKEHLEAIQTVGQIYQDPNHPVVQRLVAGLLETYNINEPQQLAQQPAAPTGPQGSQPAMSGAETMGDQLAAQQGAQAPGTVVGR